ncbi:MAG: endolytic transglycosylase MltG [Bacteroidetes bacterium]|nr:endolytic transglycosylase MltG [Bacteroidota bacterium]
MKIFNEKRNLFTAIIVVEIIFFFSILIYLLLFTPNYLDRKSKYVSINKNETFQKVLDRWIAQGVISKPFFFKSAGILFGYHDEIKIGRYLINDVESNLQILQKITDPFGAESSSVTIIEGLRLNEIAKQLKIQVGIDSARFMDLSQNTLLIDLPIKSKNSLEGFLMPDTYEILWQTDEEEIIQRMVREFSRFFNDSLKKRAARLKMSITDVVTLASIIEGETNLQNERGIVSGVYHNRLRKRMMLQADPTIQYILPEGPRKLKYSDLKINSPYNTYLNYGLPPGPINNPGREAIIAALYPAKHNYFYFVATGAGGHNFARNWEEHSQNVIQYRIARKNNNLNK